MSKIVAIAWNTFREAVRNRILYIILVFALLLLIFSGVLREFTIADDDRLIQNFGMAAINFFGLLIAIFIGITLIYNEMERKTIYTIVSKPIDRSHFLLGKYFGLLLTIYVNVLIMALFFLIALHWQHLTETQVMQDAIYYWQPELEQWGQNSVVWFYITSAGKALLFGFGSFFGVYTPEYAQGLMAVTLLTCLELAVVTALATMYSTFASPTLSAIFTLLTVVAGKACEDIYHLAQLMAHKAGGVEHLEGGRELSYNLAVGLYHIVPNLNLFNRRAAVIYPGLEPWDFIGYTIFYGVAYSTLILCISIIVFKRRNFK